MFITSARIILYAFPINQIMSYLDVFILLLVYSHLPEFHLQYVIFSVIQRIINLCHCFGLSNIIFPLRLCLTAIKLGQNGKIMYNLYLVHLWLSQHCPVHSTIIITNILFKQAGSYYIITNFYPLWHKSQLYPITQMITLLLESTSVLPWSYVILMILSL